MKWIAKIYRTTPQISSSAEGKFKSKSLNGAGPLTQCNEMAKLPVDGAAGPEEVCETVEEILENEPGVLNFTKSKESPEFNKRTRFTKINNVNYAIIIEQTG